LPAVSSGTTPPAVAREAADIRSRACARSRSPPRVPCAQLVEHAGDLCAEQLRRSRVLDHEVRFGHLLGLRQLRRDALAGGRLREAVAQMEPPQLLDDRGGHHDEAVEAMLEAILDDEGRLVD